MADPSKIHEYIDSLIACQYTMIKYLKEIHACLEVGDPPLKTKSAPQVTAQSTAPVATATTFEKLKQALDSDKWAQSVDPKKVCDPESEIDKVERGKGVLQLMLGDDDIEGQKVLDIGCWTGHTVSYAVLEKGAAKAVGYDIKDFNWASMPKHDNLVYTTNREEVLKYAPYDAILLFDVLDHVVGTSPDELLKWAGSLLADDGKIYVRFHPWTSRHAHHNYHEANKAYIHLIFNEDELNEIWPQDRRKYYEPNIGVTTPLIAYENYIKNAGLEVVGKPREIRENVESFFKIPMIAQRILEKTKHQQFPEFQMGLQFYDAILRKPIQG